MTLPTWADVGAVTKTYSLPERCWPANATAWVRFALSLTCSAAPLDTVAAEADVSMPAQVITDPAKAKAAPRAMCRRPLPTALTGSTFAAGEVGRTRLNRFEYTGWSSGCSGEAERRVGVAALGMCKTDFDRRPKRLDGLRSPPNRIQASSPGRRNPLAADGLWPLESRIAEADVTEVAIELIDTDFGATAIGRRAPVSTSPTVVRRRGQEGLEMVRTKTIEKRLICRHLARPLAVAAHRRGLSWPRRR